MNVDEYGACTITERKGLTARENVMNTDNFKITLDGIATKVRTRKIGDNSTL